MYGSNAFHPGRYFHGQQPQRNNRWGGTFGNATKHSYLSHSEHVPLKPKVVTIVRNGGRPRNNVKMLLNRRSVQSYDQLMSDIAEAFGPKYKTNRLKKLFTVRGKEVHGISDFFRDDDVFIGVGNDTLTEGDIQDIINELYPEPDSTYARSLLRDLEKQRKKRQAALKDSEADKRDSGFGEGSDGSNREQDGDYIIYKGRPQEKGRRRHDYPKEDELAMRLDKDKMKAAQEEKDRAKRQQKKMIESERRALENERRKQQQVPTNKPEDPFKRMREQKEKEREEQRRKREEERQAKIKEDEAKER